MMNQLVAHTPAWVAFLFLALVYLGWTQTRTRLVGRTRLIVLPFAMIGMSLFGVVNVFGASLASLLPWTLAFGVVCTLVVRRASGAGIHYSVQTRSFTVPGSWAPMLLILGIFATRFVVGALQAQHSVHLHDATLIATVCALYGAFSGAFFSRALVVWRAATSQPLQYAEASPTAA